MYSERMASIAVSVTAAALATAAVAFTVTGNSPRDPGATDLPVVTVAGTVTPVTASPGTLETTVAPAPGGAGRPARRPSPSNSPAVRTKTPSDRSTADGARPSGTKSSDGGDDHEVVTPKIHESDEHSRSETSAYTKSRD